MFCQCWLKTLLVPLKNFQVCKICTRNIGYSSYPLPSVVGKLGNSFYFPYFESFYYKFFSILLGSSVSHLNLLLCIGYVPYAMQKLKKSPASSLPDLQIAVAALQGRGPICNLRRQICEKLILHRICMMEPGRRV